jgi:predicted secreted protein
MSSNHLTRLVAANAVALALAAQAQPVPAPDGVVSLSASATVEVAKDLMTIAIGTTREGPDAGAVQAQLRQALDAALAEARRVARPGQLDVQTGNFSLVPRYERNGRVATWIGSTEILIEGRDMQAIGALSGRITTMTISRVGYGVSRELREKVEADIAAQAIGRFRAKASDYARQFGYAGYAVREVNVSSADAMPALPMAMLRSKAMAAPSDESLPVEPGRGTVTIAVSGTVQMTTK